MSEPVALRYDFDGNGYLYMDAGSGSDWASRVKNCEFLYTHPLTNAEPVAWINPNTINHGIVDARTYKLERFTPLYAHPIRELTEEEILEVWKENYGDVNILNFARAIIKASRGEK